MYEVPFILCVVIAVLSSYAYKFSRKSGEPTKTRMVLYLVMAVSVSFSFIFLAYIIEYRIR